MDKTRRHLDPTEGRHNPIQLCGSERPLATEDLGNRHGIHVLLPVGQLLLLVPFNRHVSSVYVVCTYPPIL